MRHEKLAKFNNVHNYWARPPYIHRIFGPVYVTTNKSDLKYVQYVINATTVWDGT